MTAKFARRDGQAAQERSLIDPADTLAKIGADALGLERLEARILPRGMQLSDSRVTVLLYAGGENPRAVAQCSNEIAPDMVARAVARASEIRSALTPATAKPIIKTLVAGELDGLSYAIWPWYAPLSGPSATGSWLERQRLAGTALGWLADVTKQTSRAARTDEIADRFDVQLRQMATNAELPSRVRLAARGALMQLDRGAWKPSVVAMHGDLHTGNLLIERGDGVSPAPLRWSLRFGVIDWSGAQRDGFPIYDLIRLAQSLRIDRHQLARQIALHCEILGCAPEAARWHLAAAFADLRANLEQFPFNLYVQQAESSFALLDAGLAALPRRS